MSSKPITESSLGTRIPSARAASSAPSAWVSEAAKIAVGRSGSRSRSSVIARRARGGCCVPSRTSSRPDRQARRGQRLLVADRAVAAPAEAELRRRVADQRDPPVAEVDQVLRRELAAGDVVDDDARQRRVLRVDQHAGHAAPRCSRATLLVGRPGRDDQEPVGAVAAAEQLERAALAVLRLDVEQHHVVAASGSAPSTMPRTRSTADGLVKNGTMTPTTIVRPRDRLRAIALGR